MTDEDSDAEDRGTHHQPDPNSSGLEDHFWLVLLALIVLVCFVIGFMNADTGPANQANKSVSVAVNAVARSGS
ncbi:hypothetical protein AB0B30_37410 [Streptomyces narbonensis]|uniref:Uncharacterized protein n=1 Tax=Streptomyces narbonensis TaxID=67333 RepID=A0ABV3CM02_9ACTN